MITGIDGLFFTTEPEATRDVLTELLEFDFFDAGDGWLLFDVPSTTIGAHPLDDEHEPFHELSFVCDDIEETVDQIGELELDLRQPIKDKGFGKTAIFDLPGGVPVEVYEPTHG